MDSLHSLCIIVDNNVPELQPKEGLYKGEHLGHRLTFVASSYKDAVYYVGETLSYSDTAKAVQVVVNNQGKIFIEDLPQHDNDSTAAPTYCYYMSPEAWHEKSRPIPGHYPGTQTGTSVKFYIVDAQGRKRPFGFTSSNSVVSSDVPVTVIITSPGQSTFGPTQAGDLR